MQIFKPIKSFLEIFIEAIETVKTFLVGVNICLCYSSAKQWEMAASIDKLDSLILCFPECPYSIQ